MKIGLLGAVPMELKHVVGEWERAPDTARGVRVWRNTDDVGVRMIAACAGMGADAARRAFAVAEIDGPLDLVLSVGFGGSTDSSLRVGAVSVLSEVIDAQTGERFALTDSERRLRIASLPRVADAAEKRRVFESYGAVMVDMESATVARMAQQRGIPMCCIKAVSDGPDAVLPDINRFLRNGQLRMVPFLASVAVRPCYWGPLMSLGRNSAAASRRLGDAVSRFLIHKDWARVNRTGVIEEQG